MLADHKNASPARESPDSLYAFLAEILKKFD